MKFGDRTEIVNEGGLILMAKSMEYSPSTKNEEEIHLLLFKKPNTMHTRKVEHEITQTHYPKI